jgi:hypothetical protein
LKEGPVASLWRVNINLIHRMVDNQDQKVEWELTNTTGKGPGKISHSSACVVGSNVIIYGGQKGEESSDKVYCLNLDKAVWSMINTKGEILPRDD